MIIAASAAANATTLTAKSQQDGKSELDTTDHTLPPKPKCKLSYNPVECCREEYVLENSFHSANSVFQALRWLCWFVAAAKKKKKKNKTPAATHEAGLPDMNTNDMNTVSAAAAVANDISSKCCHHSMRSLVLLCWRPSVTFSSFFASY